MLYLKIKIQKKVTGLKNKFQSYLKANSNYKNFKKTINTDASNYYAKKTYFS